MQVNQKKLTRQEGILLKWISNKCIGILEAITGFGKTYCAILAIKSMNSRHPDRTTIVVVPSSQLKEDWTRTTVDSKGKYGHIKEHGLLNVRVFVVNTYIRYVNWLCDLLILDEIHHYANDGSVFFSTVLSITKYSFGFGLTATLNEQERKFLVTHGWQIVDTVTEAEGVREGYVSDSVTYNLGIALSEDLKKFNEEVNNRFNKYFARFDHNFHLMQACTQKDNKLVILRDHKGNITRKELAGIVRKEQAHRLLWEESKGEAHPYSPKNLLIGAIQGNKAMQERQNVWHNCEDKVKIVKAIIRRFPDLKTIIFSMGTEMADKITLSLGKSCLSYHTKLTSIFVKEDDVIDPAPTDVETRRRLRKEGYTLISSKKRKELVINQFQNPKSGINQTSAVRALDEGFDVENIEVVIQVSYFSTKRQDRQRKGRGIRVDYDNLNKKTLVVNLYMKGTQEAKWLRSKQRNSGRPVHWIDSVDNINFSQKIKLSSS